MNSIKQVLVFVTGASALLLGSSNLLAQLAPAPEAGLIGHRLAGFDFTYDRYNNDAIDYTFGAGAAVNLPVNHKVDLSFGYNLAHTNESNHVYNHNALHASVLTYQRSEYGNGYFAGTLGQSWDRRKTFGVLSRDDDAFWAASAGYEFAVGAATAINAGLTYRDAFRGDRNVLQYRVEANHWMTREFAVVVSASYNQVGKAPDSLLFTFGVRWALR